MCGGPDITTTLQEWSQNYANSQRARGSEESSTRLFNNETVTGSGSSVDRSSARGSAQGRSVASGQTQEDIAASTRIGEASGAELALRNQMLSAGQAAQSQLGNISGIASGGQVPTALSPAQAAQIEATAQAQMGVEQRALDQNMRTAGNQLRGQLGEAGQADSSIEAVKQAVLGQQGAQAGQDIAARGAQFVSNQRTQLPLAMAQLQNQQNQTTLGANQQLFQQMLGSFNPAFENFMRERLATTDTTQGRSGSTQDSASNASTTTDNSQVVGLTNQNTNTISQGSENTSSSSDNSTFSHGSSAGSQSGTEEFEEGGFGQGIAFVDAIMPDSVSIVGGGG